MTPLGLLGLDESADARAVKRAYALRLKTTRPDESPQAFQSLNELYRAALAEVGRRARQAEREVQDADQDAPGETEQPAVAPAPPVPFAAPLSPDAPPPARSPAVLDRQQPPHDDPFALDLSTFLPSLFARAGADEAAAFRAWLVSETEAWPIEAKPLVTPHVVPAFFEEEPVMDPANLQAIVDVFALDDVLSPVDPLALAQARKTMARSWEHRRKGEEVRRLMRPENRGDLVRHMRPHVFFWWETRWIASFLTGPNAARNSLWLRWLPLTASTMMRFLRALCGENIDAITPPVERKVVQTWVAAERKWFVYKLSRYTALAALIIGSFLFIVSRSQPAKTFIRDTAASLTQTDPAARLQAIDAMRDANPARAVTDYARFIDDYPQPWSRDAATAGNVAHAYLLEAVAYSVLGRTADAAATYETTEQMFSTYDDPFVRLQVAYAMNNLALLRADAEDHEQALAIEARVLAANGTTSDDDLSGQVAMALAGRMRSLHALGRDKEALAACDELRGRFGTRTDERTRQELAFADTLRPKLDAEPPAAADLLLPESFRAIKAVPAEADPATLAYKAAVMGRLAKANNVGFKTNGVAGAASVRFTLDASGHVASVAITGKSQSADFDAFAMDMVRKATPFPPPPPGATREFSVKIRFDPTGKP